MASAHQYGCANNCGLLGLVAIVNSAFRLVRLSDAQKVQFSRNEPYLQDCAFTLINIISIPFQEAYASITSFDEFIDQTGQVSLKV